MDALVTGKVERFDGVEEDRTWSVYYGDWVKVQHLSANGYWQTSESWDGEGREEDRATIKTVSEAGVYYFSDWDDFKRFLSYYLAVDDVEILLKEDA